ncbi:MAG: DUF5640 domain-containing protein [Eubacteriales bacterium]|nr:DUF5640 domain-containing protein [Eubacteriales bacterium]
MKVLNGTFVYDKYTEYELDGKGAGCMCLGEQHYAFVYTALGDQLKLDFENAAVHDCNYSFSLNGDSLTIVGGEGTTGGTFVSRKIVILLLILLCCTFPNADFIIVT